MKIGIDFGGVIVRASEGQDFNSADGLGIEASNAIESISCLSKSHELWIISKASKRVERFTREWLSEVKFYSQTSFLPQNILFCEKRSDKKGICESLKLDYFIDDNSEVISSLKGVVPNLLYFNSGIEIQGVKNVKSWNEVLTIICS